MPHILVIAFISILLSKLLLNSVYAEEDISAIDQKLSNIAKIVSEIETKLKKSKQDQAVVEKDLQQLEGEIGQLHREIDRTKKQISASQANLNTYKQEATRLDQKISDHSHDFKRQIRLAYSSNTQSKWKVLLSQNSLQNVGRNAVIYDFVHRARSEQINAMKSLANQVSENQKATQKEFESLQKMLNKHSNAQNSLEKIRNEKKNIQAKLSDSITTSAQQLKKEKDKQKKLKKLLKHITVKQSKGKFAQQKGSLNWPADGKLKSRFGDRRLSSSQNQWTGVLIKSNKGAEIKAIYPGTVVFADWFDHYGWMIIIDHGDGFMSLYAHAEGLYKSLDESVTAGELIAVVGDSGDINEPALYFEIRRQGAPVDPADWCAHPKMAYSP